MHKVKVLFLASDPFKQSALALDEEIRAITAKFRSAEYRDALELVSSFAVQPGDLQALLLEHRPHVVHFSGHGSQAEQIILKDKDGQPKPVSKEALVDLFDVLRDNIRVVVLNACHTKPQAEAIVQSVDCAIGMNAAIGDDAAILFAAAFYQALGFGRDVETAFKLGKGALKLEGIPEDQTPELHHRKGVKPAKVFLVDPH
jgi:CHAT domain-containing protein